MVPFFLSSTSCEPERLWYSGFSFFLVSMTANPTEPLLCFVGKTLVIRFGFI